MMLETAASCFKDVTAKEVAELRESQGIIVWGTNQLILEKQALNELNLLTKSQGVLEDGEILDEKTEDVKENSVSIKPDSAPIQEFDVELLIKRQEELKKRQDYRKSLDIRLDVSYQSLKAAQNISNQQRKSKTTRNRKKINDEDDNIVHVVKESEEECGEHVVKKRKSQKSVEVVKENNEQCNSSSEYVPSDECDSDYETTSNPTKKRKKSADKIKRFQKTKDDGCPQHYAKRLKEYHRQIEIDPDNEYYPLENGLNIPVNIWNRLYNYQQEGVEWLWKIHQKSTGGLLGDEMGLGKTVQIIAFLQGLEYSGVVSKHQRYVGCGPTLIVCPATVIYQWVDHFHEWAPEFRVVVLHQSGAFQGDKLKFIKEMNNNKAIIITTYSAVLKYKNDLIEYNWHYLILDEGHKIRNHNAKITKAVKQIRTPHRLILTGTPMQNNLQELWSCFDFTNPDMLGNLHTFMEHFANPIMQGGFTNATAMQEATALSVATTLRNIISPFLLRRSKDEVKDYICLPDKSEQVLFCSLTAEQRDLYKGYLMSEHINLILNKDRKRWYSDNQMKANILLSITTLKKICNHPDLYLFDANDVQNNGEEDQPPEEQFGYFKKSGKMIVVSALLKIWKKQKHRVLLFTQSRAMILILEQFLKQQNYKYKKMDGSTSISSRQGIINAFNEDTSYDVFLLTTRVGGLGINLTGADRVIIFDPDWNPATDTQARERAWRIGQDKRVTIYRLLSAGTIEEKMYQRQVWKVLLSNQILLNPKTRKFFKNADLFDLFSLPPDDEKNPETANIFRESRVRIQERMKSKIQKRKASTEKVEFSEDKIKKMKELAQKIAKTLSTPKEEKVQTSFQLHLEDERIEKLEEKETLKTLTAVELMYLNREKAKLKPEEETNKIDDVQSNTSFDKALEYVEDTSKLYTKVKSTKLGEIIKVEKEVREEKQKKRKEKESKVDKSGVINGEKIEGLVKKESRKIKSTSKDNNQQDNYILEKLFSKKGVSGALEHDEVVQSGQKVRSLKVQNEASERADKALEALKKSRLKKWRW